MANTHDGGKKIAAKLIGVSLEEYQARVQAGMSWCNKGKHWQSVSGFAHDKYRWNGLKAKCRDCDSVTIRRDRKDLAPSKKLQSQASSAVSYEIKKGNMVKANTLQCKDCGKNATHYHHHNGYEKPHWLDVIPLCRSCHIKRHWR